MTTLDLQGAASLMKIHPVTLGRMINDGKIPAARIGRGIFLDRGELDQLLDAGAAQVNVLDNLVRGRRANLDAALATGRVELIDGDIRDAKLVDDLTADALRTLDRTA